MLPVLALPQSVIVTQEANRVIVENGRIRLTIDEATGLYALAWPGGGEMRNVSSKARLSDGSVLKPSADVRHIVGKGDVKRVRDAFGTGVRVTMHGLAPGRPELRSVFWVYAGQPEAIVKIQAASKTILGSNDLVPVVTASVDATGAAGEHQALFVPYDNDAYARYDSAGWSDRHPGGSYEVGALYDDRTRRGLVVGSIDHDLWKSSVLLDRARGGLRVTAGVADKETRDSQPHGTVTGRVVSSPRVVIGLYDDWRRGLERYGDLNAIVKPPLPWGGEVPFGWNSWAGHKAKVTAVAARAATDFVADEIPAFRSGGTASINFDSFWDNLKPAELAAFVAHAHDRGLKAGIYWTPFACWGGIDNRIDPGSPYTYRDICLKDAKGELLPKLDGAYPIDPTHPGTLAHIDRQMRRFVDLGFDYVKLDFLTHGALEGRHFDPKVPTGTAAYALGMRRIADDLSPKRIGRPFFISLSIAPLFPHGYAHSRRISCDVFANIGASEYLLNSTNYGWWPAGRLYRYGDPDHTVVYQPMDEPPVSEAEARTRFTASVISGGMLLQGDDLTKPEARERAKRLFSNPEVLALARRTPRFWPVSGTTGTQAGEAFVWKDGEVAYVAAFNFGKDAAKRMVLPLARLGLPPRRRTVRDLWTGAERPLPGDLELDLPPTGCALVRLRLN